MKFCVIFTIAAKADLREIFGYIEQYDSVKQTDNLVCGIEQTIESLTSLPQRGHFPPELERIGNREFREVHFKPYRIIYSIQEDGVLVHCVLDAGRDMQKLLQQRLLR